jgi:hypothetical protein
MNRIVKTSALILALSLAACGGGSKGATTTAPTAAATGLSPARPPWPRSSASRSST